MKQAPAEIKGLPPLITRADFVRLSGLSGHVLDALRESGQVKAWPIPPTFAKHMYYAEDLKRICGWE